MVAKMLVRLAYKEIEMYFFTFEKIRNVFRLLTHFHSRCQMNKILFISLIKFHFKFN